MADVTSKIGPFAIVPKALLQLIDLGVLSYKALLVWTALHSFSDANDRSAFPERQTIAKCIGRSKDVVDDGTKELVSIGAVEVERRFRDNGSPTSNLYHLDETAFLRHLVSLEEGVAARID